MPDEELRTRPSVREDGRTERESKRVDTKDVTKSVVAFANPLPERDQGMLFIGIPSGAAVSGCDDPLRITYPGA